MKFHYQLTDTAKDQVFIATGKRPGVFSTLELSDTDLTPDQRARCLTAGKYGLANIGPLELNWAGDVVTGKLDVVPTFENVWSILDSMDAQRATKETEGQAFKAERAAKAEANRQARASADAERKAESARLAEANRLLEEEARREAAHLPWNADGKAIVNLLERLFTLSGDEQDDRFNNWAKTITVIDRAADNGYTFVGEFISDGTHEIDREDAVYLVASTSGSRKYPRTYYRVIVLRDGILTCTDIETSNKTPGWALRIREQVSALLNS